MTEKSDLEAVEDRRAARKAKLQEQFDAQRLVDLEAVDALEVELGDSNVSVIDVPFTPGLSTCAVVRCPSTPEVKRYQARLKPAGNGKNIDAIAASEEIGLACLKYPEGEGREALLAARPGVKVALGSAALKLSTGKAADEGKD